MAVAEKAWKFRGTRIEWEGKFLKTILREIRVCVKLIIGDVV